MPFHSDAELVHAGRKVANVKWLGWRFVLDIRLKSANASSGSPSLVQATIMTVHEHAFHSSIWSNTLRASTIVPHLAYTLRSVLCKSASPLNPLCLMWAWINLPSGRAFLWIHPCRRQIYIEQFKRLHVIPRTLKALLKWPCLQSVKMVKRCGLLISSVGWSPLSHLTVDRGWLSVF
jgi:hypothetical protein